MSIEHKDCYGKCKQCAWYCTNSGCSEWSLLDVRKSSFTKEE